MNIKHPKKFVVCLAFMVCFLFLTGCAPFWQSWFYPAYWNTALSAFGPDMDVVTGNMAQILAGVPSDAMKKVTFEAPYEDVFRAVVMASNQSMWNPEKIDKENGCIFAYRIIKEEEISGIKGQVRDFYAIRVIESGPKLVDVILMAKSQGYGWCSGGFLMCTPSKRKRDKEAARIIWIVVEDYTPVINFFSILNSNLSADGLI